MCLTRKKIGRWEKKYFFWLEWKINKSEEWEMFSSPWVPIIAFLLWVLVVIWRATVPYRPLHNYDDRPLSPSHFFLWRTWSLSSRVCFWKTWYAAGRLVFMESGRYGPLCCVTRFRTLFFYWCFTGSSAVCQGFLKLHLSSCNSSSHRAPWRRTFKSGCISLAIVASVCWSSFAILGMFVSFSAALCSSRTLSVSQPHVICNN